MKAKIICVAVGVVTGIVLTVAAFALLMFFVAQEDVDDLYDEGW